MNNNYKHQWLQWIPWVQWGDLIQRPQLPKRWSHRSEHQAQLENAFPLVGTGKWWQEAEIQKFISSGILQPLAKFYFYLSLKLF